MRLFLKPSLLLTLVITLISQAAYSDTVRTLEWLELMPKSDQKALAELPPISHVAIADIGEDDQLIFDRPAVLRSTKIVPELDGKKVKIGGYIVPVEFDDDMRITEFFLVPYFGACIHVPPPPPNQIIYIKYPKGFETETIVDPFWITGVLHTKTTNNNIAQASYSLEASKVSPY